MTVEKISSDEKKAKSNDDYVYFPQKGDYVKKHHAHIIVMQRKYRTLLFWK